jgi:predicted SAM-dependent methyltransferase
VNFLKSIKKFKPNRVFLKSEVVANDIDTSIPSVRKKIESYCSSRSIEERAVVFGGHWSDNPDFLILTEEEQNLARHLAFTDSSLGFIFTEHVIEHLSFVEAIDFFTEAYRVLAPGGVMRTICPVLDVLLKVDFQNSHLATYANSSIYPTFRSEFSYLKKLGAEIQSKDLNTFFMNSMFNRHGHKFIWSYSMLKVILERVGFDEVNILSVGNGKFPDRCIERRRRGVYLGNDYQEELNSETVFDIESGVIEAVKNWS